MVWTTRSRTAGSGVTATLFGWSMCRRQRSGSQERSVPPGIWSTASTPRGGRCAWSAMSSRACRGVAGTTRGVISDSFGGNSTVPPPSARRSMCSGTTTSGATALTGSRAGSFDRRAIIRCPGSNVRCAVHVLDLGAVGSDDVTPFELHRRSDQAGIRIPVIGEHHELLYLLGPGQRCVERGDTVSYFLPQHRVADETSNVGVDSPAR